MSKLEAAEAERAIVKHLLGLDDGARSSWLVTQDQKFRMYKNYNNDQLIAKENLLSQEIIGLQGQGKQP